MSEKFDEIKEELVDFLKGNLRVDVDEEWYGFNGRHVSIKLVLGDDVISEGWHDIKVDEG